MVIVGAGHNGLTCAAYLARAGYRVQLLEMRSVVGGAAVTEDICPGFRNSTCSYVVSLLNETIVSDLELHRYGLEIIDREDTVVMPESPDRAFFVSGDYETFKRTVAQRSARDAARLDDFERVLETSADVLRDVVLETPPNIGGGFADLLRAGKVANRMRKLDPSMQHHVIKLMTMSIADYMKEWFETDVLSAMFGYQAFIGAMVSPWAPGSAYILLHHYIGMVNGKKGAWGHARGGMGAITQAMARSAEAHGAVIRTDAAVREIIIEDGVAGGVRLENGEQVSARMVVSNAHPQTLFTRLIDARHLETDFLRRMNAYRSGSGTLRMCLALDELPDFLCLHALTPERREAFLKGIIVFARDWAYCERAYDDAKLHGWSREPVIEIYIPSTLDDSLAPPGRHVMSLFCQHYNYDLPDGMSWDNLKEQVADEIIDFVTQYAPNLKSAIVGHRVLSPLDLERDFGLVRGDIMHGKLGLDQIYAMRPTSGAADYRMPVKNLYLCGSGAHPGGGVSGCPGHNAAREILRDLRWQRYTG